MIIYTHKVNAIHRRYDTAFGPPLASYRIHHLPARLYMAPQELLRSPCQNPRRAHQTASSLESRKYVLSRPTPPTRLGCQDTKTKNTTAPVYLIPASSVQVHPSAPSSHSGIDRRSPDTHRHPHTTTIPCVGRSAVALYAQVDYPGAGLDGLHDGVQESVVVGTQVMNHELGLLGALIAIAEDGPWVLLLSAAAGVVAAAAARLGQALDRVFEDADHLVGHAGDADEVEVHPELVLFLLFLERGGGG